MHDSLQISAYTPSNTAPEVLEKMFVQRHKLLEKTVAWCVESVTTTKKNHMIFIGPRGSGKTHFISMVINRLRNKPELQEKMLIIWLGEDDIITSLTDLVLAILEHLVQTDPEQFDKDCLQHAKGQPPSTVVDIIFHSITEQIGTKTILLVKENMSDVFAGLKDDGQKKLRAFLQEKNNIAILSSSQQLFRGIASRDAAFFGFFDTYHLDVLGVEDAKQLISNIAAISKNQTLVDYLNTSEGRYRIRALHHLAGGNHRLYVELADFLTKESLDDFVSALTQLTDSLTPYFQERIRSLPPQQGKIVQKLCEIQGAIPVKELAEKLFIGERSVAKQLGDLAKKGYVISHKRGKQSYYEMAEPLMRLVLEIKSSHGKQLKMVASLMRVWFSDSELQIEQAKESILSTNHKKAVLSMDKSILVTINNQIEEQIAEGIESNDFEKVIAACSEIINAPETDDLPLIQRAVALLDRAISYYNLGNITLACNDLTSVIAIPDAPKYVVNLALFNIPELYYLLLQPDKAEQAVKAAFKQGNKNDQFYPSNTSEILQSIAHLGSSFWQKQIISLLELYAQYEALEYLSEALIHSISIFIEDQSLSSALPKWQQLWQQHGEQYPDMQLALQVLQAAMLAVEQKNDKPLLSLPKEVRELVQPLLVKALTV